jgi:hypothetical protein
VGIWKAAVVGATDRVEDAKFLWREGRRGTGLLLVCVGVAAKGFLTHARCTAKTGEIHANRFRKRLVALPSALSHQDSSLPAKDSIAISPAVRLPGVQIRPSNSSS